jgi:hypothetical protein
MFGAEFVDPEAVGDYGDWDSVPNAVVEEVCFRTPSFSGWQQERWFTHCHDASLFVAPMGASELQAIDPGAYSAIAEESGFHGQPLIDYMKSLDKDTGPTAYVFRCAHCGVYGGYSDVH